MTGLDKMVNQILNEANSLAAEKKLEGENRAKEILAKAKEDAQSMAASIDEKSAKEVEDCKSRGRSSAEQKRRTAILLAKQEVIAGVIEKAYEQFCGKTDAEYFDTIQVMLEKFVLPQEGSILFSQKDLSRMPADLPEAMAKIAERRGGKLTVSKETREIDGGFILVYGGIEENCSFRALFDSNRDELQDIVQKILF